MKIAVAAYPVDWLNRWNDYVGKLRVWVRTAAEQQADLLVFPENAALELASLAGEENARDVGRTIEAISARIKDVDDLHASLAREFKVHICAGSGPMRRGGGQIVNRSRLFTPDGTVAVQDKTVLEASEAERWHVEPGTPLRVFETPVGRLAILHGDAEHAPSLARALAARGAEVILMPASALTPEASGLLRAAAAAAATTSRAVVALSLPVGAAPWLLTGLKFTGASAVFSPPRAGIADDGILAQGKPDAAGWTYAEIDLAACVAEQAAAAVAPEHAGEPGAAAATPIEVVPLGLPVA